jgi:hypothetical protein
MLLHLPSQQPIDVGSGRGGAWVPLDMLLEAFDFRVKRIGAAGLGVCPTDVVCAVVPESARRPGDGQVEILAEWLVESLGMVLVKDEFNSVMLAAPPWQPATDLQAIPTGLSLPDIPSGVPTPLVSGLMRTVVFAWASW